MFSRNFAIVANLYQRNSVWDSKGRFSETAIKYGIQGIPTFILINPEGTIIDKWSGYGKGSLINQLKKKIVTK